MTWNVRTTVTNSIENILIFKLQFKRIVNLIQCIVNKIKQRLYLLNQWYIDVS